MGQVVLVALFTAGVVIGVVLGLRAAKSGNRLEQELRKQIEAGKAELAEAREETGGLREARAAAEARVVEAEKNLADQRSLLGEARGELEKTFRALASEALQQNNSGFLTLAEQKFRALQQAASTDLESKKGAIEQLLQPLSQTLEQYQSESRELQERRAKDISAVGEQLRSLAETQNLLRHETAKLVTALRSPEVRGNWGEIALRRIAELAGMTRHCDFAEQVSITTEDGRLRPDVVVHLPSGREVVIDSKVPLAAYLDAISAPDEDARDAALDRHVSQVHQHIKSLSQNQYWEQFPRAPEFVVMFIRNDSFLAAAAERDPELTETALAKKVVIATPGTLFALLKAIEYGWKQEEIAASAKKVSDLGVALCSRTETLIEYVSKIGAALGKAMDSYDDAVGSLNRRYLPAVAKFQAAVEGELDGYVGPQLELLDRKPRAVAAVASDE